MPIFFFCLTCRDLSPPNGILHEKLPTARNTLAPESKRIVYIERTCDTIGKSIVAIRRPLNYYHPTKRDNDSDG